MVKQDYGVKIKLAYLRFKWKIALYFTLWLVALIAGAGLLIAVIFFQYSRILRVCFLVIVLLIFVKLAYDASRGMRHQYDNFKQENGVTDETLKRF
jgi:hypothetical protein